MLRTFQHSSTGAGHSYQNYVHLLVGVLADPSSGRESHEIGVELLATFKSPDRPLVTPGTGQNLPEIQT